MRRLMPLPFKVHWKNMSTIKLTYRGYRPTNTPEILLPQSKSLAIRTMLLHALADSEPKKNTEIENRDVQMMFEALHGMQRIKNVEDAGTPFRLLLAYFAFTHRKVILDCSEGLRKRPMAPLIAALRKLGAELNCLEKEGFAPIEIVKGVDVLEEDIVLELDASQSSQFASALLLCLPLLKGNKTLKITGKANSRPYIMLTLKLMKEWGVDSIVQPHQITVKHGSYKSPKKTIEEADWSAASYFYAAVATGKAGNIQLNGLLSHSLQGDARAAFFFQRLGVNTQFNKKGALLTFGKTLNIAEAFNLADYPDLAPALVWIGAYLKLPLKFEGLENLKYKESNRIDALNHNLKLVGAALVPNNHGYQLAFHESDKRRENFKSFNDHRMLMSLAVWAFKEPVIAENPKCVEKSFPHFWHEWVKLNFEEEII